VSRSDLLIVSKSLGVVIASVDMVRVLERLVPVSVHSYR